MGHYYPCEGCIILPVCSEVCDKLYVFPIPASSYTHIVEDKYCPDCGCDKGLYIRDSVTYCITCYRCASVFGDAGFRFEKRHVSIVSRSYYKGRSIKEVNGLVEVITFSEFIEGIK